MHQAGVVALAQEIEQIARRIDVGGERVAQVGIEIGEAGAVGNDVERALEARLRRGVEAQAGLADVAFDDFDFFAKNAARFAPCISCRRSSVGDSSTIFSKRRCAEVVRLRRISSVILRDVGNFFEQVHEPDLADEAGDTDEQEVTLTESVADGEAAGLRDVAEYRYRATCRKPLDAPRLAARSRDARGASSSRVAESNFSREMRPSMEPLASQASGPRGRTTGSSSRPVARHREIPCDWIRRKECQSDWQVAAAYGRAAG